MLIACEDDLWNCLSAYMADPNFGLERYPKIDAISTLRVTLRPGSGETDRAIMNAQRMLQRHVDITFRLAKAGRLTGYIGPREKELITVRMSIEKGSTVIAFGLAGAILTIMKIVGDQYGTRAGGITGLAIAAVLASGWMFESYENYHSKVDVASIKADADVKTAQIKAKSDAEVARINADMTIHMAQLNAPETEHQDVAEKAALAAVPVQPVLFSEAARADPTNAIAFAASDFVPWRPAILDLAPLGGTLQLADFEPIPRDRARGIAAVARAVAKKEKKTAAQNGRKGFLPSPWATEVIPVHTAPGAMRLGVDA